MTGFAYVFVPRYLLRARCVSTAHCSFLAVSFRAPCSHNARAVRGSLARFLRSANVLLFVPLSLGFSFRGWLVVSFRARVVLLLWLARRSVGVRLRFICASMAFLVLMALVPRS